MSLVQQILGSGEMSSEVFQEHVLFLARNGTFAVRLKNDVIPKTHLYRHHIPVSSTCHVPPGFAV